MTPDPGEALTVRSPDGTDIAFWRSGSGPPLLLVHGVIADHTTTWRFVHDDLARQFTVYAMDRRGRGASTDAATHTLQREAGDVAAVIDAIGGSVNVLGHSYGAVCALEAALLTPHVRRLVLYEGIPLRGADYYRAGIIDELEAMIHAGDIDGTLVTMLREIADVPAREIDSLRAQRDAWTRRLANTAVMPRELRAEQQYSFDGKRFAHCTIPTLFLVGGDSHARELENARSVVALLPDARVTIMPGQKHLAMYTAPALFVESVTRFLL